MARTLPDGWTALAASGVAARERETLGRLASALPADYTIYHAVHWTRIDQGFAVHGEVDFVVVNRSGDLLLIEQKTGLLLESAQGLRKHEGERRHDVALEMSRSRDTLLARLRQRPGCQQVQADSVLYCPDYRVRDALTAGVVPERIIDARRSGQLAALIQTILPAGEERPATAQVHRFLQNLVALEPDVSTMLDQADVLVTRLSGGLALWARRLELPLPRLRVNGTAGSGKTQLALAEYRASLERGGRPLYVCFNRPLADHFARVAPPGGVIANFHLWCDHRLRSRARAWDYHQPDAFTRLVDAAAALPFASDECHDCLIIDEGQDFTREWADLVLAAAAPGARCLWLEDPLQNLYDRPPLELPGWATLHAPENHRSPRSVVSVLNRLLAHMSDHPPVECVSPLAGDAVEFLVYGQPAELQTRVREALRLCWSAGFRAQDVALLSYHGHRHSTLLSQPTLAGHALRAFTGRYDLFGMPEYSSGELLAESVLRFKGQSAPAVVLCEVDFAELDLKALRRLFVGATRARLKLVVVMSAQAAAAWPDHAG
ncbi:MAG: ATP-binding domain-containing protein [Pseudomonadota bacterium]|nr:ATP-binding domain-containing protein [Pseudomonadota bacterium]